MNFLKESSLKTPLLAAEGFVILKIQIQGAKSTVKSTGCGALPDRTGVFD
ncbi:MAG: hypothetical protein VW935_08725 [Novosphingobium sp.]|nr:MULTISPECIES: hypothetical protein [Sphingomonas]MDC7812207.1 hypothetical protein [Sphingomonas koreensis]